MFFKYITFIFSLISVTIGKPQLITFKDGKIGVNFLGFSADAGLGGLLTGNAAHGGLSASAGTPFGQRAAAGIGGYNGEGGTYGGAFAGATAGQGVSARAGLGGVVGGGGILGAESSAGGQTRSVIKTVSTIKETSAAAVPEQVAVVDNISIDDEPQDVNVVQKIKPPKKYYGDNFEKRHQVVAAPIEYSKVKSTIFAAPAAAVEAPQASTVHQHRVTAEGTVNGQGFFDGIFNIPISTLRAVNDFLNRGFGQGSLSVRKTVDLQTQTH